MPLVQSVARGFRALQSFVTGLYGLLMPLCVLVLLVANVMLLYVAVFRKIDPVTSHRVVSVEPANRYLDRNEIRDFKVVREICSSRPQQVEVVRSWTEARGSEQLRPIVVFTSLFYELKQGCHLAPTVQTVPETLPPGQYVYDVILRSCNALNQCQNRYLDPIPLAVVGGMWRDADIPMPPAMSPPPPTLPSPGPSRGGFAR